MLVSSHFSDDNIPRNCKCLFGLTTREKLIGLSENPALSQKLKCSAECVAQRGEGVIVQGDVAVVTEVVVEPDKAFLLKTNSNTA